MYKVLLEGSVPPPAPLTESASTIHICLVYSKLLTVRQFYCFKYSFIWNAGGENFSCRVSFENSYKLQVLFFHFFTFKNTLNTKVRRSQREKCPNTEFFWSVFSRIRTEYGEISIAVAVLRYDFKRLFCLL